MAPLFCGGCYELCIVLQGGWTGVGKYDIIGLYKKGVGYVFDLGDVVSFVSGVGGVLCHSVANDAV